MPDNLVRVKNLVASSWYYRFGSRTHVNVVLINLTNTIQTFYDNRFTVIGCDETSLIVGLEVRISQGAAVEYSTQSFLGPKFCA